MKQFYFFSFAVALMMLSSCEFDQEPKKHIDKIDTLHQGRYEVVLALRNGKATSSLNKGFYAVKGDSIFTNLTNTLDSVGSTYTFKKNELKHNDSKVLDFTVARMTQDSLILVTEMRGFNFDILLVKLEDVLEQ